MEKILIRVLVSCQGLSIIDLIKIDLEFFKIYVLWEEGKHFKNTVQM